MWLCRGRRMLICAMGFQWATGSQDKHINLSPICGVALRQGEAWNIHSLVDSNETILNIAMPEYSAEYWVTCIDSGTDAIVHGTFPEWVEFASISIYDMSGNLMIGRLCHVDTYQIGVDEEFVVSVGNCVGSHTGQMAVVARYYGLMNDAGAYHRVGVGGGDTDERPAVTIKTSGALQTITNCPRETSDTISNNIEALAMGILQQVLVQPSQDAIMLPFHTVPVANQIGLFPNDNSVYLVKFVNASNTEYIELVGKVVCPASPKTSISFYGISVTNTQTSETDDSLSWQALGATTDNPPIESCSEVDRVYRVRVAMRTSDARTASHTHKLLWNPENKSPAIVLRFMINPRNPEDIWYRFLLEHVCWIPTWLSASLGIPTVHVETV